MTARCVEGSDGWVVMRRDNDDWRFGPDTTRAAIMMVEATETTMAAATWMTTKAMTEGLGNW